MKYDTFTAFFCFAVFGTVSATSSHCAGWDEMKKELESHGETSCNITNVCSAINCSGLYFNHSYSMSINVVPCIKPVILTLYANIPKLNIFSWVKNFTAEQKHKYPVPGGKIQDRNQTYEAWIWLHFQQVNKHFVKINYLSLRACQASNKCPKQVPILKEQEIRVPKCNRNSLVYTPAGGGGNACNYSLPEVCSQNEACYELKDGGGECRCLIGYERIDDVCALIPDNTTAHSQQSSGLSTGGAVGIAVGCLLLLSIVVVVVFLLKRYNFSLRDSGTRRYEELMIDNRNDDDDDDPPLA